ncbi:Ni/Fe-hydrogenase, b-type cytochrome subunit [Cloacibacterium sp. TD35]|uniref:Ni/Fe-hydrogenase, b-type cytochrome subunit n=1 Tax=Cloacibacterium sp. TD35 TaxID=2976818 RepID=UPI00237EDB3C|nr:Ni/Fe-hydrogenase, b-type cytochrome subunit [Cloacibacterium sp. TD35]WDT68949.1 Ni/Fe-hydrogenase, b-type cytochrome subunit [Cloacibacterium sp. TD35]
METTKHLQEEVSFKTVTFRRAYIWQLPVRFFHWINGFAITFLIITGFLIANPPAIMTAKEASGQFWMGLIRMVHFISAYAMVAVMFMRVYWAFVGNRFANWRQFVPFDKKGIEKMWHVIKHDIFLFNEKEYKFTSIPIGHNAVAAASYMVMFILAVVMIFTGFALYAPTSTWFFPKFFAWATSLVTTDEFLIRRIHHIVMWAFILFIAVHFYLVLFHDWLEGRGESSAMVSGYKFVRKERFEDYKEEDKH